MLEFKSINEDTANVMKDAVNCENDYYTLAQESIKKIIPCEDVHILNSANSCLITLSESIPDPVVVCDMGGWKGFIRSCELFNKKVEYIKTDNGLINIEVLDDYLNTNDVKSLYITSLAGYTAFQPLDEIQELCKLHEVVLIVDISGSTGCERYKSIGDIQISSTGSPKIVNIENGGFICNMTKKITLNNHLIKSMKADNITCAGINNEIKKAPRILEKNIKANQQLKNNLINEGLDVIHPEHKGLNTIIKAESKSKAKKTAYKIRQDLNINGNIITIGPNYNRIKHPSINIEIKNLNTNKIIDEDMNYLSNIILKNMKETEDNP